MHLLSDGKASRKDVRKKKEKVGLKVTEIQTAIQTKATFPLQYLEDIVKAASGSSQEVTIKPRNRQATWVEYGHR